MLSPDQPDCAPRILPRRRGEGLRGGADAPSRKDRTGQFDVADAGVQAGMSCCVNSTVDTVTMRERSKMFLRLLLLIIMYALPVALHAADQGLSVTNFVRRLETAYNDKDSDALSKMIADKETRERVIRGSARTKQKLTMNIREMKFCDSCVDVLIDMSDDKESHPVALQLSAEGGKLTVVKCGSPEAEEAVARSSKAFDLVQKLADSANFAQTNLILQILGAEGNRGEVTDLEDVLAAKSLSWIGDAMRNGHRLRFVETKIKNDLVGVIIDEYSRGTIVARHVMQCRGDCLINGDGFLGLLSKPERDEVLRSVDELNKSLADLESLRLISAINRGDVRGLRRVLSIDGQTDLVEELSGRGLLWVKEAMDKGVRINQVRMKIRRNASGCFIGSVPVQCAPGGTNVVRYVTFKDGKIGRAASEEEFETNSNSR